MSLAATLAAQPATNRGSACTVAVILERLDIADHDALTDALHSQMTNAAIARALNAEDHRISSSTVQRHRAGDCQCR
jgi:hypothetical protein